jgi:hypothetical protein
LAVSRVRHISTKRSTTTLAGWPRCPRRTRLDPRLHGLAPQREPRRLTLVPALVSRGPVPFRSHLAPRTTPALRPYGRRARTWVCAARDLNPNPLIKSPAKTLSNRTGCRRVEPFVLVRGSSRTSPCRPLPSYAGQFGPMILGALAWIRRRARLTHRTQPPRRGDERIGRDARSKSDGPECRATWGRRRHVDGRTSPTINNVVSGVRGRPPEAAGPVPGISRYRVGASSPVTSPRLFDRWLGRRVRAHVSR